MSQPMEHRTITANQARTEYVATCNEIVEIEMVISYLDVAVAKALTEVEPLVTYTTVNDTLYAVEVFWHLLDLYREAHNRRLDLYAARDYAYAVWKAASAESTAADAYVSKPQSHR
ncbi:hypothetical protein GCM10009789_11370 [Kribbella sancticallisti]|uniref:Uncharacterized protein n=1 Tax=Kribbella sancticallisti TaxID=460087 RepID=A0ABN2CN15_9ACTN